MTGVLQGVWEVHSLDTQGIMMAIRRFGFGSCKVSSCVVVFDHPLYRFENPLVELAVRLAPKNNLAYEGRVLDSGMTMFSTACSHQNTL
jgi:hypothetical protein